MYYARKGGLYLWEHPEHTEGNMAAIPGVKAEPWSTIPRKHHGKNPGRNCMWLTNDALEPQDARTCTDALTEQQQH